jgi:hypothetical protein
MGELKVSKVYEKDNNGLFVMTKQAEKACMQLHIRCAALAWCIHFLNTHKKSGNPIRATIEGRFYVRKKCLWEHNGGEIKPPQYVSFPNDGNIQCHVRMVGF